ncbi:MAG: hypothetical protein AAGF67_00230 [Verrucomicrobiota bacterium]
MRSVYFFLLVFALLIAGWVTWFSVGNYAPRWFVYTLVIWNWLVGPVLTIVLARDAKDDLDYEDPSGPHWVLVRAIISTPLGCFGFVSILLGLVMAFFLFKGLIIDRDPELIPSIPVISVILLCVSFGFFCLRVAFTKDGPTRKEDEAAEALRLERLSNPDWDFYEHHLGRPVPELLRKRHGENEIFLVPFEDDEGANAIWSGIHPDELWDFEDEPDLVLLPFAEFIDADGFLALLPGADESDRVFFYDQHEDFGKNFHEIFASIEEFFESIEPED